MRGLPWNAARRSGTLEVKRNPVPSIDPQKALMPSVLDRLIDPDSAGTAARRGYGVNQMTDAVRRDLTELLNTRQTDHGVPPEFDELLASIFGFGLPDLTSMQAITPKDRQQIGRVVETVIARFEPRLKDIRATLIEQPDNLERTIRFRIDARLCMDPAPAVAFDTILELTTGRSDVKPPGA
jgi:type VI secretion system protein ImpF